MINIRYGLMMANEGLHGVKKSGKNGFLMKVDFHKAFDIVAWEYLEEVMSYIGFGKKWISLVS
jgi:hypothetical protein